MSTRKRNIIAESFVAHSRSMRESPAWRHLPDRARRILDRLELEHMRHGGACNGALVVTYGDFAIAGIRRQSIPLAIRQCERLGFLEVTQRGGQSISRHRWPSKYQLTYVNGTKASPAPTHEWRRIRTDAEAQAILAMQAAAPKNKKPGAKTAPTAQVQTRYRGIERAGCENGTAKPSAKTVLLSTISGEGQPSRQTEGGIPSVCGAQGGARRLRWSTPVAVEVFGAEANAIRLEYPGFTPDSRWVCPALPSLESQGESHG